MTRDGERLGDAHGDRLVVCGVRSERIDGSSQHIVGRESRFASQLVHRLLRLRESGGGVGRTLNSP